MISEDNEARLPTLKLSMHKRSTQGRLGRSEMASCTLLVLLPSCLEIQRKGIEIETHIDATSVPCRKTFLASCGLLPTLPTNHYGGLLGKRDSIGFKLPSCVVCCPVPPVCVNTILHSLSYAPSILPLRTYFFK